MLQPFDSPEELKRNKLTIRQAKSLDLLSLAVYVLQPVLTPPRRGHEPTTPAELLLLISSLQTSVGNVPSAAHFFPTLFLAAVEHSRVTGIWVIRQDWWRSPMIFFFFKNFLLVTFTGPHGPKCSKSAPAVCPCSCCEVKGTHSLWGPFRREDVRGGRDDLIRHTSPVRPFLSFFQACVISIIYRNVDFYNKNVAF